MSSVDWLVAWCAVVVCGAVWTALLTFAMVPPWPVSKLRLGAGAVLMGGAVLTATPGSFAAAQFWHARTILGGSRCRAVDLAERPRQIFQLDCVQDIDGPWFVLAVVAAAACAAVRHLWPTAPG